ncbi:MAG: ATP synthase subunit b, sodium ion specific [candidate division BRC1 bacterium ADurb.BinA364]|nr:MAG: ATP synthase subunit b, sodium ion specific [candidate division BRC1 bacterium ADurb.BinA364]
MTPEAIQSLAQVLSQALAFFLFYLILKRYAWGPVLGMIDERNKRIESSFRRAEEAEEKALELKAHYDERMRKVEAEAREKILDAVNEGRRLAAEIQESARAEAQRIHDKAREMAQIEGDKARIALKEDMVRIAMNAAEKLIRERLDGSAQRRLVESFVEEMSRKS